MYRIIFHPRAAKQLRKLTTLDQKKILHTIHKLKENPLSRELNIRRFYRTPKSYRIRTGNLRVIYEIDSKRKEVYIRYLGYRGQIY